MSDSVADRLPPTGEGLTFEKVWAMFQETDRKAQETRMEIDRKIAEERAEERKKMDRLMAETRQIVRENARSFKETDRIVREVSQQMGGLNNTFGKVVEHMVAPKLREKFHEAGLIFQRTSTEIKFEDTTNDIFFEVDVMLENSSTAMLVETKAKARIKDVKRHIERLEKMRAYADLHGDGRKFLGAFAGAVMNKDVRERAHESGFYVLVPSGDTFNILPSPGNFKPREW